jgi:hypothetical protein
MKYFLVQYLDNTTAIVAPCPASQHEIVLDILLRLIQSRDIDDPYTIDLMQKLAAMLPRCDVPTKGFAIDSLPKETLQAIFYGTADQPCLIAQIHALDPYTPPKNSDKLPLKLSGSLTANLVSQLIVMSRETGCNTTDLIHQYSLCDLDNIIRDFSERVRPYDDRVEERLQEMWDKEHASKMVDPDFLFNLSLNKL